MNGNCTKKQKKIQENLAQVIHQGVLGFYLPNGHVTNHNLPARAQ